MKTTSYLPHLAWIGLIAALLLGVWKPQAPVSAVAQPALEASCSTGRSVQVSGAAVINVTPDRARIQLGVQSNGDHPEEVQDQNSRRIQQVIQAVRALGVDAKDIATDYYIVYPVYDYNALTIKGYRIDNTVSITLQNVSLADDTVLAALKAGANEVQDVQFYTSELRKYRDQARDEATKAAREKAQALGQAAGAQAGCVLSINENTWTQYYGSWRGGRDATMWAQNVIQNAPSQGEALSDEESPMSLGQIAVRAEVSASFSLQ